MLYILFEMKAHALEAGSRGSFLEYAAKAALAARDPIRAQDLFLKASKDREIAAEMKLGLRDKGTAAVEFGNAAYDAEYARDFARSRQMAAKSAANHLEAADSAQTHHQKASHYINAVIHMRKAHISANIVSTYRKAKDECEASIDAGEHPNYTRVTMILIKKDPIAMAEMARNWLL